MIDSTPASETAVEFALGGGDLVGVLHRPPGVAKSRAVLIVVGGPQYRTGSHRQFVLLARHLASAGYPVLRFDYRGMGDSFGAPRDFENIGADIKLACDVLVAQTAARDIAIWGLCDAASAACFYAHGDARVRGIALLNPWVRTAEGQAKARLRHYYLRRAVDPELWKKLLGGGFRFRESLRGLTENFKSAAGRGQAVASSPAAALNRGLDTVGSRSATPLPERMLAGLRAFDGQVLLVLSGQDLTADEFRVVLQGSRTWRRCLGRPTVRRHELPDANHTFSRSAWRDEVARVSADWLQSY